MSRLRVLSLVAFALLLGLVGVLPAAVSAGDDPRLTLSPTRGPQGTSVTATVQGVEREVTVTLYFNGSQVAQSPGLKDKGGAKPLRTLTFIVPATAPLGPAKVLATLGEGKGRVPDGDDDGREGWRSVTFTVTAPATATSVPPTPTFTAIPPTATATFVPTATVTSTAVPTDTPVPPTATATTAPTSTPEPPTPTATTVPTSTPEPPTPTATTVPTSTPEPPTATATVAPTSTPVPPTATATATPAGYTCADYPVTTGGATLEWDNSRSTGTWMPGQDTAGVVSSNWNSALTFYCGLPTSLSQAGYPQAGSVFATSHTFGYTTYQGHASVPNLPPNTFISMGISNMGTNVGCGGLVFPLASNWTDAMMWVFPATDLTGGKAVWVRQNAILDITTGGSVTIPGPLPLAPTGWGYLLLPPLKAGVNNITYPLKFLVGGCTDGGL